ncbi:MAG: hypothetical protein KF884_04105 [Fimbriimonadaceae bacterium]|nr:hypothetical protein [Fimbriimonadaceae bacterium]QYK59273.1 MAG: hypothetical protein KF884_04105 [Fimbriimonadaceae bacterium]
MALSLAAAVHAAQYALLNPPFESPDETGHVAYASFVAETGRWPDQRGFPSDGGVEMGHHHPLPYFAMALVVRASGTDRIVPRLVDAPNPVPWRFRHPETGFANPESARAFYALRLLGCLLAGATVWFTGLAARYALRGPTALLPPLLVATLPQFAFVCGSVSNDPWAAAAGAATLWGATRLLARGDPKKGALAAGVAVWCKKSGLALAPSLLIAGLLRGGSGRRRGLLAFLGAMVLALPILVRNQALYGDPLGSTMEARTYAELVEAKALGSGYFFTSFPYWVARSFFAHFGWMSVSVSLRLILPLAATWAAGLVALGPAFKRPRLRRQVWLHLATFSMVLAGLVHYNLTFTQPQGRLLFPALAALAVLAGVGLGRLGRRWPPRALVFLALVLAVVAVGCLLTLVRTVPG